MRGEVARGAEEAGMAGDPAHGEGVQVVDLAQHEAVALAESCVAATVRSPSSRARASVSARLTKVVAASPSGRAIRSRNSTSSRAPVSRSSSQPSRMNPRSE